MQTENSDATSLRQLAKMPNHVLVVCGFLAVGNRRQLFGTRVCHVIVYLLSFIVIVIVIVVSLGMGLIRGQL